MVGYLVHVSIVFLVRYRQGVPVRSLGQVFADVGGGVAVVRGLHLLQRQFLQAVSVQRARLFIRRRHLVFNREIVGHGDVQGRRALLGGGCV